MPTISVSLSEEDYKELSGSGRSAKLRSILKEHREHKCPSTLDRILEERKRLKDSDGFGWENHEGNKIWITVTKVPKSKKGG